MISSCACAAMLPAPLHALITAAARRACIPMDRGSLQPRTAVIDNLLCWVGFESWIVLALQFEIRAPDRERAADNGADVFDLETFESGRFDNPWSGRRGEFARARRLAGPM